MLLCMLIFEGDDDLIRESNLSDALHKMPKGLI